MNRPAFIAGLLLSSACALWSCNAEDQSTSYVDPVLGDPCRYAECGDHGICATNREGQPECMCEVGYAGATCDVCEGSFHRDFYDRCLTDTTCADQEQNPCGVNGDCVDDANGVIACECAEGYEGPRCNLCADRYAWDREGRCLPLFITVPVADSGVAEVCLLDSCAPYATCSIVDGKAECSCRFGYLAPSCTQCAPGYYLDAGECVPSENCEPDSCPDNASCITTGADVTCQCFAEYTGPACQECASGHHLIGSTCVADETCGPSACPEHATCSVEAGEIVCACNSGYAGASCETCATGYHVDAGSCVPDQSCANATCSAHASCVVVGGVTRCDCEPGWDSERCDRCVDLATESTAFELVTGWATVVDTCATRPELSIARMTVRSRHGMDYVQLCARSSFHALSTQHIALTAGVDQPAELVFWEPVVMMSFDYASVLDTLALDIVADGAIVGAIDLAPHFKGSATLRLDSPADIVELRSRNGVRQTISIDNVVYHYERCR